ncbi:MAG TPA: hypothetical protein VI386_13130 [Candidatus Sulfotelmatobacter sp.]
MNREITRNEKRKMLVGCHGELATAADPQGLKPLQLLALGGTAEAVPFPKQITQSPNDEGHRVEPRETKHPMGTACG